MSRFWFGIRIRLETGFNDDVIQWRKGVQNNDQELPHVNAVVNFFVTVVATLLLNVVGSF